MAPGLGQMVTQPILVPLEPHQRTAMPVVVISDEVEIWVALRCLFFFFYHVVF